MAISQDLRNELSKDEQERQKVSRVVQKANRVVEDQVLVVVKRVARKSRKR